MIENYIKYFEQIAVAHPDIAHKSEEGSRAFFQIDIEDLLSNFAHGIKPEGFSIHLANYLSTFFNESQAQNTGSFVILTPYDRHNPDHKRSSLLQKTERIGLSIIVQMQKDSLNHPDLVFFNDQFETLKGISCATFSYTTADYIGHIVEFGWKTHIDLCDVPFSLSSDRFEGEEKNPTNTLKSIDFDYTSILELQKEILVQGIIGASSKAKIKDDAYNVVYQIDKTIVHFVFPTRGSLYFL